MYSQIIRINSLAATTCWFLMKSCRLRCDQDPSQTHPGFNEILLSCFPQIRSRGPSCRLENNYVSFKRGHLLPSRRQPHQTLITCIKSSSGGASPTHPHKGKVQKVILLQPVCRTPEVNTALLMLACFPSEWNQIKQTPEAFGTETQKALMISCRLILHYLAVRLQLKYNALVFFTLPWLYQIIANDVSLMACDFLRDLTFLNRTNMQVVAFFPLKHVTEK